MQALNKASLVSAGLGGVLLAGTIVWTQAGRDHGPSNPGQVPPRVPSEAPSQARTAAEPAWKDVLVEPLPELSRWEPVEDLPREIAVFPTVFWEPLDTETLRALVGAGSLVEGKTVLEIGTGSGLVALCCLQAGAARVVATDVNPRAIANAAYNARLLGLDERLDLRLVPAEDGAAYWVLDEHETFDLIVSNPPWEDDHPLMIDEFALYDPNFQLLRTLLAGLKQRLNPGGRALLAYGSRDAIETLLRMAPQYDLEVAVLDSRELESLPDVFLPGMLLEVRPTPPG